MLDFIRKKSSSTAVLFIFGIIILVFVFWGFNPGGSSGKRGAVATVNGISISVEAYEDSYEREIKRIKDQLGGNLTDEMLEAFNLRQRALDMLINDVLIVEEARAQGKEATNEHVQNLILANPAFQKEGLFNKDYYFEILRQNRLNSADYERSLRESITAQQMWSSVVDGVTLTDDELWKDYETANAGFTFDYAAFSPADFIDDAPLVAEELKSFYDKNSFSFTVPTEIKVFYARAGFKVLGEKITISDEDTQRYYKENNYDYITQKEVRASHILIKSSGDGDAVAEKKAEAIYQRLKRGEGFTKLAKENSDDPGSAAKGGDVGFFGLGMMVTQFEDAAFSLGKGEMSELVKTSFGFHIIKVTDIKEEGVKPLKEVKESIKAILLQAQAVFAATDAVEGLRSAFEGEASLADLEKIVNDAGLKAVKTGFILEDGTRGTILSDQMLKNAAFGLNAGGVSAPVETTDAIYLIKVVERVESHVAPFEEALSKVKEVYKKEKAVEGARAAADEVLKKLTVKEAEETFEALAKEHGVKITTSGEVIREQAVIADIGLYIGDMNGFFKLTKDEPYYPEVVFHNNAFHLFRLSSVKSAERAPFDADIENIRVKYINLKRAERQNSWINGLREKAEITVNQDLL